jgi:hypothetical protein
MAGCPELAAYPPAIACTLDPVCVGEFTDNKWFIAQFERASKLLPSLLQGCGSGKVSTEQALDSIARWTILSGSSNVAAEY